MSMAKCIIEILIDYSGSMGYMKGTKSENMALIDGVTRFELEKQVIENHIFPVIDFADRVILRLFRSQSKEKPDINTIYDGDYDICKLRNSVENIPNPLSGGTPIAAALKVSKENLINYPNCDRKIILITDGIENSNTNYIVVANGINKLPGIPCKIYTIGLGQNEMIENKARHVSTGGYFNIRTKYLDTKLLNDFLLLFKSKLLDDTMQTENMNNDNSKSRSGQVFSSIKQIAKEEQLFNVDLMDSIQNQIEKTKMVLKELEVIKERVRISQLLHSGINATTLTIDDDYSEEIREKSESFLYDFLCRKYGQDYVKWLNQNGESYQDHDFEILDDLDDAIIYIECKGTPNNKQTFYLTDKEWGCFLSKPENYQVYRVYNLENNPKIYCIEDLLFSILSGKVVPYLERPEILKEKRVYLTIKK